MDTGDEMTCLDLTELWHQNKLPGPILIWVPTKFIKPPASRAPVSPMEVKE